MKCCGVRKALDRVSIQSDTGSAGDEQPTFTTGKSGVPCSIESVRGQESWRGRQLEGTADYVVEFRTRRTDVTPQVRFSVTGGIFDGKTLNVSYVQDIQPSVRRKSYTLAFCTELTT